MSLARDANPTIIPMHMDKILRWKSNIGSRLIAAAARGTDIPIAPVAAVSRWCIVLLDRNLQKAPAVRLDSHEE
jgi:hypothetical protein